MQRRTFLGTLAAATMGGAARLPCGSAWPASSTATRRGSWPATATPGTSNWSASPSPTATSPHDTSSGPGSTRRRSIPPSRRCSTGRSRRPWSPSPAPPAISRSSTACAARKIPVMMEKPLAVGVEQARAIERAAAEAGIPVLVNYETTWYPSNHAAYALARGEKALGEIRKVVVHDGHRGPKEIGVQPEFLAWLTDPEKNGAGALFDFGCYGANLMTWLMDDARPTSVTAVTRRFKPEIYREGGRRGDDHPGIPRGAGDHPGVVELAVRPEGHGDLRPDRPGPDGRPRTGCGSASRGSRRRSARRRGSGRPGTTSSAISRPSCAARSSLRASRRCGTT